MGPFLKYYQTLYQFNINWLIIKYRLKKINNYSALITLSLNIPVLFLPLYFINIIYLNTPGFKQHSVLLWKDSVIFSFVIVWFTPMLVRLKNYMTYNDKKVYCDLPCNGHKSTTMIMLKNVQDVQRIYI